MTRGAECEKVACPAQPFGGHKNGVARLGRRHVFNNQAAADFASGTSAIVFRTTEAIW